MVGPTGKYRNVGTPPNRFESITKELTPGKISRKGGKRDVLDEKARKLREIDVEYTKC
jgi:hypothetical protein